MVRIIYKCQLNSWPSYDYAVLVVLVWDKTLADKTQTYKTSAVFHASHVMFVFTQGWLRLAEVILLGT